MKKLKYMLVDGNALIHRGFHAILGLATKKGEPTGAVYGFTMILLRAIADIKPTHIACTFDLQDPTFRHKQYKEYKATRVKAPQELYDQIPRVKEVVKTLNIPIFEKKGFEADDVLGTLSAEIYKEHGKDAEIIIATGDLDTLQLVNGNIKVYTLKKGISDTAIYDEKAVRARYGLNPNQMVDYKALRGDPSDNIPGVKGIGEKGAVELIKHFHSIDKLYEKLHIEAKKLGANFSSKGELAFGTTISSPDFATTKSLRAGNFQFPNKFQISNFKTRVLNLLIQQEEQARKSYDLVTIRRNVPIETDIPEYEFDEKNQQKILKLFQKLEFKSLIKKLPKLENQKIGKSDVASPFMGNLDAGKAGEPALSADRSARYKTSDIENPTRQGSELQAMAGKQDYILVEDRQQLEKVIKELSSVKEIVIDTETTSIRAVDAELVGIGLAAKKGKAYYVPAVLALESDELKSLLSDEKISKVGHNIKYDYEVLSAQFTVLSEIYFDTMVASYLLNAGTRQYGLSTLAFNELGYQMQPIEELIGKGKTAITMDKVNPKKVSWYCCEDTDMTLRLKQIFEPELKKEKLDKIFNEIEMPLVEVLASMEMAGIKLDRKLLNGLAGEAEIEIKKLEKIIHKLTGEEFNINSPKQLKEVLFEKLGLVPIENRKTKTGLSTAASELEKMRGQHKVIPKILEYRELAKLQNTYLLALPGLISKKTKRLHTSYNQTIAATGRLSSTEPNLQNIPVRGEGLGSKVRQAFVAEKGYKLLSLDYSQIELRIVAHLAKDKKMLEVFKKGEDIHTKTAMEIFGVSASAVTKDMRRDAKTINFGILYGLSSFGLSSRIEEINRVEAKEFISKYFKAYRG